MEGFRRPTKSSSAKAQNRPPPLEWWKTYAGPGKKVPDAFMGPGRSNSQIAMNNKILANALAQNALFKKQNPGVSATRRGPRVVTKTMTDLLSKARYTQKVKNSIDWNRLAKGPRPLNPRRVSNGPIRNALKERMALLKYARTHDPKYYAQIVAENRKNTIATRASRTQPIITTMMNAAPTRPRSANVAPGPLAHPLLTYTDVAALLDVIVGQKTRINTAGRQLRALSLEMRASEKFWAAAENRNKALMQYVPPSPNEIFARNNQVRRQLVRQRKNFHFLKRASRTRNAWIITRNDINGTKFGVVAKGLDAARRNGTLPREAKDIVGAVDRLWQGYTNAITPQQMRAWLDTVQAFVLATQQMMNIFRIAKDLALTVYMIDASQYAQIVESMKLLPATAMSFMAPSLTPYRNDRTRILGATCKIIMMTLMIAVLLLFVYLKKIRLIRR
jgi:hypothetical protein